jgi:hypothetical protein
LSADQTKPRTPFVPSRIDAERLVHEYLREQTTPVRSALGYWSDFPDPRMRAAAHRMADTHDQTLRTRAQPRDPLLDLPDTFTCRRKWCVGSRYENNRC